jgi:hypothetical protein
MLTRKEIDERLGCFRPYVSPYEIDEAYENALLTARQLGEWLDEAWEVLKRVEWQGDFCDEPACPYCLGRRREHANDCRLAALLKELEEGKAQG